MTVSYTTLLGLAKPVPGTEAGTWGDTVNNNLTDYLDSAVAGAQIISGSLTAVTLSKTTGASLSQAGAGATGSSQYQIIRCTGNPASLLTITVPAADKTYVVINATSTSQSVKIVGAGPTTGVTILSGKTSIVAWSGTDFVEITPSTISGTLPVLNGGTGATTLTGVLKGNGTSAFTAASSGTDYSAGTSALATGILKSTTTTGALSIAVAGTDYQTAQSVTGIVKSSGTTRSAATAGTDYVAPGGALGTPSSGTLTNCTFPTLNQNTTGTAAGLSATLAIASGGTNSTATPTAGGAGYGTGTAHAYTTAGTTGQVLTSQGAGAPIWATPSAPGTGTVTSVAMSVPTFLTVTGSPITSSGTLAVTLSGTALPVANGGTGVTTSTGSGNVVLSTSPTLTTPVLGTPSSGTLSSCTVDGTDAVGFRNIPVNSQSGAYTAVLADSGKCILHPSTDANARTFTIPANGSVAYPIGTAISFVNMTSQVVSIAITTDTMYLAGTGTTGTRSLAQYGTATALKMTSTTWIISGAGLT